MAYATGTILDGHDLLPTITLFAQSNGFTLAASDTFVNPAWPAPPVLTDVFQTANGFIELKQDELILDHAAPDIPLVSYMVIGLTGASDVNMSVNNAERFEVTDDDVSKDPRHTFESTSAFVLPTSVFPITYHLFAYDNPKELFCIVRYGGSKYMWLAFGDVAKTSSLYTGGHFFAAPFSLKGMTNKRQFTDRSIGFSTALAGAAGHGGFFWPTTIGASYRGSFVYYNGWGDASAPNPGFNMPSFMPLIEPLLRSSPNIWNNQTTLLPMRLTQPVPSDLFMDIGSFPNVRALRIDHIVPEDVITLGEDQWKVFPFCQKDTTYRHGSVNPATYDATAVDSIAQPYYYGPRTGTFGWAFKL